jgi:hypothetical protein
MLFMEWWILDLKLDECILGVHSACNTMEVRNTVNVTFEVLTGVLLKIQIFWDVILCS